ncbi:MAG: DUF4859 domain-containing protein [Prevotella sp.]|nr:DUF4859 domain-containing protein [Prevotella sp.]
MRNLLTAVVCLFAGVSAQAQFTGGVEQYPTSDYRTKAVKFSLTEVATALGTDAATFAEAYTAFVAAEAPEANLLFLANPDGTLSDVYSANDKGFYITSEGAAGVWDQTDPATAGTWFASAAADAENDVFAFYVGQYPDTLKAGDKVTGNFVVKYNGQEAKFAVSLSVIAKPEIPAPTTLIEKDLNIVGEKSASIEQFPRTGYDADAVQIEATDLVEKLGFESGELLADVLGDVLYCTWYNSADVAEGGGLKKDSLTNTSTAGAPGFWLHAVQNENGEETGECSAAAYGGEDKFYIEAFAYNAETGVLSCNLGQYPGAMKANEQWYANVYVLRGDKAYKFTYNLKINEREQGSGTEGMNKMGEAEINCELWPDATNYTHVDVYPDVDAIAAALGCTTDNMSMQALDDSDNWATSTANNGGFWYNEVGRVVGYGTSSYWFIEPAVANDFSLLHVGQYPGRIAIDEKYSTVLYFVNGENYYAVTINMTVVPEKVVDGEFTEVASRTINIQQMPDNGYGWSEGVEIPTDFIEQNIGSTWVVYGLNTLDENGEERAGNAKYSKSYTITESPGFWLNSDGRNAGWGDPDAKFGISAGGQQSGKFSMIQYPNRCSIGEVLKTKIFFVNEETAEMVTFNFNYYIVESIVAKEVVGTTSVTCVVTPSEDAQEIDLAPVAEALGVTVDDLLSDDNEFLKGVTDGQYSKGWKASLGINFDYSGKYDEYGDMYIYFDNSDGTKLVSGSSDDVAEDFTADGEFCFDVDNKVYTFYVRFVSPEVADGINNIATDTKKNGAIYDLSGRQVKKPTRGLYIQNGKKFIVK